MLVLTRAVEMMSPDAKIFANAPSRVLRIARGSGTSPMEVELLLTQYKTMAGPLKALGGKNGLFKGASRAGTRARARARRGRGRGGEGGQGHGQGARAGKGKGKGKGGGEGSGAQIRGGVF